MEEKQVTIEGKTYKLPRLFCHSNAEPDGAVWHTFPLPESQLDRFMMKISIGYPSRQAEKEILKIGSKREDIYDIEPVVNQDEVSRIQEEISRNIHVSDKILEYTLSIIETRTSEYLTAGLSTRGALTIVNTARANAFFHDEHFVIPEDIRDLVEYTIPSPRHLQGRV